MTATPLTLILLAAALIYHGTAAVVCLGAAVVIEFGAWCIRRAEIAKYEVEAEALAAEQVAEMVSRN